MLANVIFFFFILFLFFVAFKLAIFYFTKNNLLEKSNNLRFLQIKIPRKDYDDWSDQISSMKSNIEVMNQLYKNFSVISSWDFKSKNFWQDFVSLEFFVEKEVIKFIVWIPFDYIETFEKLISSFYPWCVVDKISQPKLLDAWKSVCWGDFFLAKSDALPFKTYDSFEIDPMDTVLSSCGKLNWDEKFILQFIISPLSDDQHWDFVNLANNIKTKKKFSLLSLITSFFSNIFSSPEEDNKSEEEKSNFSQNHTQEIDKKSEDDCFFVTIRALAISPDVKRAESIITDLERSMTQFTYSWLNKIKFKKRKDIDLFLNDIIHRVPSTSKLSYKNILSYSKWQVFSTHEISTLFHIPHPRYNKNPRISWQNFKIVPAPDTIPDEWLLIWHNLYWWVNKEIRIKPEDRFRHFYLVWQTWTWKTSMLLVQAKDDLKNWRWFCFMDPHWDFCEELLAHFPKERIDDLIYFDASNFNYPIWLNALEANTEEEKDVVVNDLVDMFINLYWHEIFWPRIQDYFRNGALTLMDQPDWWSLVEIVRLFADEAFQKVKLKNVKNPAVRNWWEKTYAAMWDREKAEAIPFFQAKFWQFTTTPIIRNIIWQTTSSFKMSEAMQQNKVVLVNLSKWLIWEINSELIWRILTTQIKVAALQRASMPASERVPFYLYIDEFQNYVSQSIESILSEARKYKLWLTVAHQYIDQLKASWLWWDLDLSKAIFGNVWSIMSYKVWPEDAEFLERVFSPEFTKSDLSNMDKFKWVMRLSVDTQPTRPFSIAPLNPYTTHLNSPEKINVIKEISSLRRWRKKELVEKEIYYKIWV